MLIRIRNIKAYNRWFLVSMVIKAPLYAINAIKMIRSSQKNVLLMRIIFRAIKSKRMDTFIPVFSASFQSRLGKSVIMLEHISNLIWCTRSHKALYLPLMDAAVSTGSFLEDELLPPPELNYRINLFSRLNKTTVQLIGLNCLIS